MDRNSSVASEPDRVERSVVLPAPIARVWETLTEAEQLAAWFGAAVEIDARPGGRATFRWADGLERAAVLEDVEPERRLSFRWLPFARVDGEARSVPPGRVEFLLEQVEEGTRLTVAEWTAWPGMALLARPDWPGPGVAGSFEGGSR